MSNINVYIISDDVVMEVFNEPTVNLSPIPTQKKSDPRDVSQLESGT